MVVVKNKIDDEKIKFFDRSFIITVIVFIVLIVLICCFPLWFTSKNRDIDFTDTGQIGDTIGGIMGPFIAIVASILTFLAFWAQFKANQEQVRQFAAQKEQVDNQLTEQKRQFTIQLAVQKSSEDFERFENKYFELVRFHRANLDEMNIGDKVFARKCFVKMYSEFKFCFDVSEACLRSLKLDKQKEEVRLTSFAYKVFFFGIGEISNKQHKFNDTEVLLYKKVSDFLSDVQSRYEMQEIIVKKLPYYLEQSIGDRQLNFEAFYFPFDGHISRLAHYYRHLFHTVKFVVKQNENLVPEIKKLEYLQTLRAQLSNHEQVMLYYNAVSGLGDAWLTNGYFTTYKMIHNLPFALADFGITPNENTIIKEGVKYWESLGSTLFEQDE